MSSGKKWRVLPLVAVTGLVLGLAACGGSSDGGSGGSSSVQIGVILPDTTTSPRWEANDKPALKKAFDDAKITSDIQNAGGSVPKFSQLCDTMINEGVKVLLIVNLDSASGSACLQKAATNGVKSIDYDRLTLGGGASYYVSFDNNQVGALIGNGLEQCLVAKGDTKNAGVVYVNGAPTDNNATLFKAGYDKVMQGLQTQGKVKILSSDQTGEWDANKAGTVFDGLYSQYKSQIQGVVSANDTMATGIIASLQKNGLAGKIPVTGQDASVAGLQQILSGTQCMTVYKNSALESDAASKLAIDLIKGDTASADALAKETTPDTTTKKDVPSVLIPPVSIFQADVKKVISDGYQSKEAVCTGSFAALCTKAGVS